MTRSSSNAWTSVAPVDSTCACAAATASSKRSPASSVSPPYDRVASIFAIGASCGMKIVALIRASRAAHATAWPWLPALAATTPARRSSSASVAIVLYAPRILNEPVRWRFSALRKTWRPLRREKVSLE